MSSPYVGEIRMFGGSFAPVGWALCQGQSMPISQNDVLFNLIGTTYGGDGQNAFNLPDLQGRVPVHQGQGPGITQNYTLGETGGVESVTLTAQTTPNHTHSFTGQTAAGQNTQPQNGVFASIATGKLYVSSAPAVQLAPNAVQPAGGNQPHENMQPYLCVSFILSLFGIYPTAT